MGDPSLETHNDVLLSQSAQRSEPKLVALALFAGLVAAAHIGKLPPALPVLRADFGLTLVMGGWVVSLFAVTATLTGIFIGSVADRLGHLTVVVTGLVTLCLGGIIGIFAESHSLLLVSRIIEGTGFVSVAVATPSLIVSATSAASKKLGLVLWSTYMPSGIAITIVASPFLLDLWGWRGLWGFLSVLSGVLAALLLFYARGYRNPSKTRAIKPVSTLWSNIRLTVSYPGPWLLMLIFAAYTVQWVSLMVWLPTFLIENNQLTSVMAALLTASVVAGNTFGVLFGGWLLHRKMKGWLLILLASATMGLSAIVIFLNVFPDPIRYLACLLFSFSGGFVPCALISAAPAMSPTPAQLGTTNGMLVQGSNVGQLFGPPAMGAIVAVTGSWASSAIIMVAAAGIALVLSLFLKRLESRRPPVIYRTRNAQEQASPKKKPQTHVGG